MSYTIVPSVHPESFENDEELYILSLKRIALFEHCGSKTFSVMITVLSIRKSIENWKDLEKSLFLWKNDFFLIYSSWHLIAIMARLH